MCLNKVISLSLSFHCHCHCHCHIFCNFNSFTNVSTPIVIYLLSTKKRGFKKYLVDISMVFILILYTITFV